MKYFDCPILALAVEHGHLEIVKYLVENHDVDVYEKVHRHYTAINYAILHGHLNIMKYFIEKKNVDVDKPLIEGTFDLSAKIVMILSPILLKRGKQT